MSCPPIKLPAADSELARLVESICEGTISPAGRDRLESLLADDRDAKLFYVAYLDLHAQMQWLTRGEGQGTKSEGRGVVGSPTDVSIGAAVELPRQPGAETPGPEPLVPPFIVLSPLPSPPLSTTHYPLATNFVGGPVFSYMVASVILGMMLLGAWAYKITHYRQFAENRSQETLAIDRPELVFVGRITGMKDCRWSDPQTEAYAGASIPLGRKYALSSGLMQITYDSGTKVILQGPCTYEVESRAGGYLSLGKLTARVETDKEAGRQGDKEKMVGDTSPHSLSPCLLVSPSFSVRTPTAVVTDLGTEFGVEVSDEGNTTSHVFRGSVKVQVIGESFPFPVGRGVGGEGRVVQLSAGESARVEKGADGQPSIARRAAADGSQFVLKMPPPKSVRDSEAYAELVLSLNPVVYYRMERPKKGTGPIGRNGPQGASHQLDLSPFSSVVFDSAPGGHHGELRLGNELGVPYRKGRFGDALWLRGSAIGDRVVVPDYPKAKNDRLTVVAWVTVEPWTDWWPRIAGNGLHGPENRGQFKIGLFEDSGALTARIVQRDSAWVTLHENVAMPQSEWQHVAFVVDGATLRLYRNGREVASAACVGVQPEPPVPSLSIGSKLDVDGSSRPRTCWRGLIDELAIFNSALTADDIERLYSATPSDEAASENGENQQEQSGAKGGDP